MKKIVVYAASTVMMLLVGCSKEITLGSVEIDLDQSIYSSVEGTATIIGHVTDDGGELTDAGICYTLSSYNPEINDNKHSVGAKKDIRVELSGLSKGTYRVRAYASNRVGTWYSETVTMTITGPTSTPTVVWNTTDSYYNSSQGTASLFATVTNNGGATVTAAGFCYIKGTSGTPTTANSRWTSSDKTNIHVEVNNLSDGTYRMRPYATNSNGTGYGETMTMTIERSNGNSHTLDDYLGTWSCSAYEESDQATYTWSGTQISYLSSGTHRLLVEGLWYQSNGGQCGPYFYALGDYDETNDCIRLYGGWGFTNTSDYIYWWNSDPNTELYSVFHPVHEGSNGSWYALKDATGSYHGQALLKFNSAGKLVFSPSEIASSDGYYADGYMFYEYYAATDEVKGWWPAGVVSSLVMTKTSSKGGDRQLIPEATTSPEGLRKIKQR